jgi:hypothetical protein
MAVSYNLGTISVANGGTTVTGIGATWTDANGRVLDTIRIGSAYTKIKAKADLTHLTIPEWTGTDVVDSADYEIFWDSPLRNAGAQAQDVATLIDILNSGGYFIPVIGDAPDPGQGIDGQYALKTNSGGWLAWLKVAGEWVLQGAPVGVNYRGEWAADVNYVTNDRASRNGQSFTSKQASLNIDPATDTGHVYWDGGGVKGDPGVNGATWSSGTGIPAGGNGGDFYYRTSTFDIYKNTSGTWATIGNIKGPIGATPVITGTSSSVVTVGLGAQTFATQTGASWVASQRVRAVNGAGDRVMVGPVTSYSGASLVLNVDYVQGVGADSAWTLAISGEIGPQGGTGPSGQTGNKGDTGSPGPASTVPGPQGVKGETGAGLEPGASGTLTERATYDGQAQGFQFLQTDVSPFRLWVKASNTSADWAGPTYIGGSFPVGDMGHITDSVVQSFDFGHIA